MTTTDTALDVRTRRLIVTLPDVSGEEADIAIDEIKTYLGDTAVVGYRVDHALDDAPVAGIKVAAQNGLTYIQQSNRDRPDDIVGLVDPDEIRKLAALLMRAADEAEA